MDISISLSENFDKLDKKTKTKVMFIFRALLSGWTIKKISDTKFQFTKDISEITKEISIEDNILSKFMMNNLDIESLDKM
jgi:hypothetical protein